MLEPLLELPGRRIFHLPTLGPAVYYLVDKELHGVMINSPPFSAQTLAALNAIATLTFIFYPSRRGACDVQAWREASGAETMAFEAEAIEGEIDITLDRKSKFSRTIDFLPMAGVTPGACAMRLRNKPSVIFFGPILTPDEEGWPNLLFQEDDYSYESRLFGALGLQDLKYEYAFTDVFTSGHTQYGPAADAAIQPRVQRAIED